MSKKKWASRLPKLVISCVIIPTSVVAADVEKNSLNGQLQNADHNGYLYTVENGADNAILGYKVTQDGTLQALADSPFPTGGTGLQAPVISQSAMVMGKRNRHMFAINPGSQDISVMRMSYNGKLRLVHGGPFSTGGDGPLSSLAISKDILYAAHNAPNTELRGLNVSWSGRLNSIAGAVYPLPQEPASTAVAIEFTPSGENLVSLRFSFDASAAGNSAIETYNLDSISGLLSAAPGSPFATSVENDNSQSLAFTFNPVDSSQMFVGNAVNIFAKTGTVSSYLIANSGQISPITDSPASSGNNVGTAWMTMTQDGQHLYAINTASDNISHFTVDRAGKLTLIDTIEVLDNDTIDAPRSLVFSDDDEYLYVLNTHHGEDGNGGTIVGFERQNDGSLQAMAANPLVIIDEQPIGLKFISND